MSYHAQRDVGVNHDCVLLLTLRLFVCFLFPVTELLALRDFVQVLPLASQHHARSAHTGLADHYR